jgi:hypothetical protein
MWARKVTHGISEKPEEYQESDYEQKSKNATAKIKCKTRKSNVAKILESDLKDTKYECNINECDFLKNSFHKTITSKIVLNNDRKISKYRRSKSYNLYDNRRFRKTDESNNLINKNLEVNFLIKKIDIKN